MQPERCWGDHQAVHRRTPAYRRRDDYDDDCDNDDYHDDGHHTEEHTISVVKQVNVVKPVAGDENRAKTTTVAELGSHALQIILQPSTGENNHKQGTEMVPGQKLPRAV